MSLPALNELLLDPGNLSSPLGSACFAGLLWRSSLLRPPSSELRKLWWALPWPWSLLFASNPLGLFLSWSRSFQQLGAGFGLGSACQVWSSQRLSWRRPALPPRPSIAWPRSAPLRGCVRRLETRTFPPLPKADRFFPTGNRPAWRFPDGMACGCFVLLRS